MARAGGNRLLRSEGRCVPLQKAKQFLSFSFLKEKRMT
jgi:hypothetical protein